MAIMLSDWRGTDLRVGVNVIWINRSGDGVREGEVIEIGERQVPEWKTSPGPRETYMFIKVRPKDRWARKVYLTRIDRVTVVA